MKEFSIARTHVDGQICLLIHPANFVVFAWEIMRQLTLQFVIWWDFVLSGMYNYLKAKEHGYGYKIWARRVIF